MKVCKWVLVSIMGLFLFFSSMTIAWIMGGGQIYAEPCHSVLWCNEENKNG